MNHAKFNKIAQSVLENLPTQFAEKIDNVCIEIKESPEPDLPISIKNNEMLLGLYQGIPLTKRGNWYGTQATTPDTISLFQRNIEAIAKTEKEITEKIREVLIHELGHYFGMNEQEIRTAMRE
jgi:predicted Zn-dependent protease with MMP-like domain